MNRPWIKNDFFWLSLILILFNVPYWHHAIWTKNDSIYIFQVFYSYYNEFFLHHDLLRWFPYGMYGMRGDYFQPNYLSPCNYLAIILGSILRIKDVLLVFKFSELLEQFILLAGTYLLSRSLFKEKLTTFFVSIGVIGSSVWLLQVFWNLRSYYALPLVLYFLFLCIKGADLRYLFIAGIIWIMSLFGIPGYHSAVQFVIFFIFLLLTFAYDSWPRLIQSFKKLPENKTALALAAIFIFLFVLYAFVQLNLYESIQAQVYARDPITHKTPINEFVTYGENTNVSKLLGLFFAGLADNMTYTFYLGLLPLIFWIYGILEVRIKEFTVFSGIVLFLTLFSLGDSTFVARTIYYIFPPMQYFRYIGAVRGILRIFILIGCGFGLDHFLTNYQSQDSEKNREARGILGWSTVGFIALALFLNWINQDGKLYPKEWPDFFYFSLTIVAITVSLIASKVPINHKVSKGILIAAFLFELFSYQNLVYAHWPARWDWAAPEVRKVSNYDFQSERDFKQDLNLRVKDATKVVESINDQLAVETYSFLQYDPCIPGYLKIYEPIGLSRLIDLRAQVLRTNFTAASFMNAPETPVFLRTIGCNSPKLKLVSNVSFADNLDQAGQLVRDTPDIDQHLVLRFAPNDLKSSFVSEPNDSLGSIEVKHFSFNALATQVTVTRKEGAFLYYADSYHPGWHAKLDHKSTKVLEANLAFKAVFIPEGTHTLELSYFDGLKSASAWLVMLISILFSGALFYFLFKIIRENP